MTAPIPIAFWGSPQIAASLLERLLHDQKFAVKFVVTQQDKARSVRGRELLPCPVKKIATAANIPVLEPTSLKKEAEILAAATKRHNILFHVILAYGKIIPPILFEQPRFKSVNFHASLLPLLRGASPIESALLLDYCETGWSLQRITAELDAGDVYGQLKVPIAPQDDAVALYQKLQQVLLNQGPELLYQYASGALSATPQNASQATFCGKFNSTDARLDFHSALQVLRGKARAFSARGGVYALWRGKRVKIQADYHALAERPFERPNHPPGTLVTIPAPAIAAADGLFWVSDLQPEGKRRMSVQEFLNGYGKDGIVRFE